MLLVGFLSAAVWVDIFASELVSCFVLLIGVTSPTRWLCYGSQVSLLTAMGYILDLSEVIMGATILAWGNCIGDLTADVLLARNKREGMAITACFAGPMFNLLIIVGFGVLLHDPKTSIDTSMTPHLYISFGFLVTALIISILVSFGMGKLTGAGGNCMPKRYAFVLWVMYAAYVLTMVIYEAVEDPGTK